MKIVERLFLMLGIAACGQEVGRTQTSEFASGLEKVLSCDSGAVSVYVYPFNRRLFQVAVKNVEITSYLNGPDVVARLFNASPLDMQSDGTLKGEGVSNQEISGHHEFGGFLGKTDIENNELRVYRHGQGLKLELVRAAGARQSDDGRCSESCDPARFDDHKIADWYFQFCTIH